MAVDLHSHSTFSDGSETPTEVVRLAARAGVAAIALTDHDILTGLGEGRLAAAQEDIELIPGVELSLDWSGIAHDSDSRGGMHLVVLWVDDEPGPLQDRLADLRRGRDDRNQTIVERLAHLGLDIPMAEVTARAGGGAVGRPHIAGVMVDHGYVPDIGTAFDLYLGNRAPAYVGRRRLAPDEALRLARLSGGVPILAHPYTLRYEHDPDLESLLRDLAGLGLVGLETDHSGPEPARRRILRRMADRVGLAPSGGSDFHGAYKPGVFVGTGTGDLSVPDEFLEVLRRHRGGVG